jgi:hypothetical protein
VWPVFLFVAVEIFARVMWPYGIGWRMLRWVGLLPVAGLAALVSYRHLSGLLAHYGEEPIIYYVGPLAVDGLMVMATGALLATGRYRNTARDTPAQSVSVPVAVSVAAPGGSAAAPSQPSPPTVAAAKPDQPHPAAPAVTPAVLAQRITPHRPASPAASAPTSRPGTKTATRPKPSKKATPPARRPAPSATDTSVTAPDRARQTGQVVAPELLARVRAEAIRYRTEHGTPISPGQLAVRLRVTSEQAQQALAVLNLAPDSPTAPAQTVNGTPKGTR